ncbi:MAG: hypothetical protein ABF289_14585 [Clostridiales bacterium]
MGVNNFDKDKRDQLLVKINSNLVKINQLTKLDMANTLLEEILKNMNNNKTINESDRGNDYGINIKTSNLKEINTLIEDMFRKEMSTLSNKIDAILVTKINFITKITVEYISKVQEQTNISYRKLNKFNKRRKIIDFLKIFNLAITPILLIFIIILLLVLM